MFYTNLDKKIDEIGEIEVVPTMCVWSDLLGFSKKFATNNWILSEKEWKSVAKRLQEMQIICQRNIEGNLENCLVSNDAIIRNLDVRRDVGLIGLSMWFRSLIYYFAGVNTNEKRHRLPGMRLVLSAGERMIHNCEKITMEDYVLNYTKPDPNGVSNLTKMIGERVVMYNHEFMQMNTAFSKSYIIDSVGSKGGIKGNRFFVDISVVDFLKEYARVHGVAEECIIDETLGGKRKIAFLNNETGYYYLGLELKKPVEINTNSLKTTVYRLDKFYPWDEKPEEFWFDVEKMKRPSILWPVKVNI